MEYRERIALSKVPGNHSFIRIHPSLLQHLTLQSGQTCSFVANGQSLPVAIQTDNSVPPTTIFCSSQLLDRVNLSKYPDAWLAAIETSRVTMAPTIGILCNVAWNTRQGKLKTTKQLLGLEKMVRAGEEAGALCFLFRLRDVNTQTGQVKGYRLIERKWSQVLLPLPDVIYDQVVSRKLERSAEYKERRNQLASLYGRRFFNNGFFDKWQIHQWLVADAATKKHVPATIRYSRVAEAVRFISRHPTTFLKPLHGSLGLGIVRLMRQTDGSVAYDIKRGNLAPLHGKSISVEEVVRTLRRRFGAKPYVLQQGIQLATYKSRPFDVRILLQRDGNGVWKRTKMFARVAKSGDFTSNLSSGGEALPVTTVLADMFGAQVRRQKILQAIRRVSRTTTEAVEEQSGTTFGELGIDIGIDEQGGVWIIEVNSKPWKSPVTEKGRQDLVDLAFARPMQYAIWLAQHK